jgi:indolepyruvate decarboxylase
MTHEPSVGFAADAYARLKGLGVALVTYGAGGLNIINSVGLAYAEESPLLVISGSPETRFRSQPPLLHHCVKEFDTQYKVFTEVTAAQAFLDNPKTAQERIEHVLETIIKSSRPGYIEIPRDMVNAEIEIQELAPHSVEGESPALLEAVVEILQRLAASKRPVMLVGVEVSRFRLKEKVIELAELLNIPVSLRSWANQPFRNFIQISSEHILGVLATRACASTSKLQTAFLTSVLYLQKWKLEVTQPLCRLKTLFS